MKYILLGILVVYLLGYLNAMRKDRKRPKRVARKNPSHFRAVRKFKTKTRGWHLEPKSYVVNISGGDRSVKAIDHKNWIRLYPNPGYRWNGKHRCRNTHKTKINWPEGV